MNLEDLMTVPKFVRRRAERAINLAAIAGHRDDRLRDLLISPTRPHAYLGEIVTLHRPNVESEDIAEDVYAVEVRDSGPLGDAWVVVVHGKATYASYPGPNARWIAMLHALAILNGEGAMAVEYASRILGLPTA